jgi:hypothetical protein
MRWMTEHQIRYLIAILENVRNPYTVKALYETNKLTHLGLLFSLKNQNSKMGRD